MNDLNFWAPIAQSHSAASKTLSKRPCSCSCAPYTGKKLLEPQRLQVESEWPLWSAISWTQKKLILARSQEIANDSISFLVSNGHSLEEAVQGLDFTDLVASCCTFVKVKPPSDHSGRKAREIVYCALGRMAEEIISQF